MALKRQTLNTRRIPHTTANTPSPAVRHQMWNSSSAGCGISDSPRVAERKVCPRRSPASRQSSKRHRRCHSSPQRSELQRLLADCMYWQAPGLPQRLGGGIASPWCVSCWAIDGGEEASMSVKLLQTGRQDHPSHLNLHALGVIERIFSAIVAVDIPASAHAVARGEDLQWLRSFTIPLCFYARTIQTWFVTLGNVIVSIKRDYSWIS